MRHLITILCFACLVGSPLMASEFRHFGDFLLQSHIKLTAGKTSPIPIKPMLFRVHTDGIVVRVSVGGDEEAVTTFEIYRSDGITRQRPQGDGLELIPGVQALSRGNDVLRHLRMSAEFLTITTFPGVSDQTIISYAVAAEPIDDDAEKQATTPAPPAPPR